MARDTNTAVKTLATKPIIKVDCEETSTWLTYAVTQRLQIGNFYNMSYGERVRAIVDVLNADGYILGTPANLGYMSGALKHFFDTVYYPCLDATGGRPYGCYIHGNNDTSGALRAIQTVVTGLRWQLAQAPVEVTGPPDRADLDACWELGAALAAGLSLTR